MRRAVLASALLAVVVLSGCGGGDDGGDAVGERPELPTDPPELWNPCDGLELAAVSEVFATPFDARTGTPAEPECTFTPVTEGGPAVEVNYQLFAGTLEDLIASFGEVVEEGRTEVLSPDVPAADDARIVVDVADDGTLAVSGFVRNGRLVQLVNVLDPPPFRRDALASAVEGLLGDLAAHAADSGLNDDASAPGASPSDAPTE